MIDLTREKPIPVAEAAELFGVHRRTIDSWIEAGLDKLRMKGLLYTSLEALQRFGSQESKEDGRRRNRPSPSRNVAAEEMELRYGM